MGSRKPRAVIARRKRVGNDDSSKILGETPTYIHDFERMVAATTTARELCAQMLNLRPDSGNRGALWNFSACHKTLGHIQAGSPAIADKIALNCERQ
jgi:hypothetical protein